MAQRLRLAVAAVALTAAACSGSASGEQAGPAAGTVPPARSSAPGPTVTTTTVPRPQLCTEPTGTEAFEREPVVDDAVFSPPWSRTLPPGTGGTSLVAVGDDVIVLATTRASRLVPKETSDPTAIPTYANEVTASEARLQRVDRAGHVVWTRVLGTASDAIDWNDSHQLLVVDGDAVRAGWSRLDVPLPVVLADQPSTAMVSTVGLDGALIGTEEIAPLQRDGAESWRLALGPGGVTVLASQAAADLAIELYADGRRAWTHRVPSTPAPLLAVDATRVYAGGDGTVDAWARDGSLAWELRAAVSGMTVVTAIDGGALGAPAVFLALDDGWGCALDERGDAVLATPRRDVYWLAPVHAWWVEGRLIVFNDVVTLGRQESLITFGPDGGVIDDVAMAGRGDVVPSEGSTLADVARTEAGALAAVGSISERVGREIVGRSVLMRLPAPAGLGDLSGLPLFHAPDDAATEGEADRPPP